MDSNQLGLPVEVWQRIFELSTQYDEGGSNPESKKYKQSTYSPFSQYRVKHDQNLRVVSNKCFLAKLRLLHVCQCWHSMAQRLAYEVIYVGNHSASLVAALKRSARMNGGQGYGQFVRCIVLASASRRAANKHAFSKVIEACPNATMIVKYDQDHSIIPTSLPLLPALVRYDWSFNENDTSSDYPPHPSDIYTLRDIIRKAPNLEYLSICLGRSYRFVLQKVVLELEPISTNITTLRLCNRELCPSIVDELARWSFPNVKHLIADTDLLTRGDQPYFNSQIEIIEITERATWNANYGVSSLETTSRLFNTCPNLREIYFSLTSYLLTQPVPRPTKIEKVGIHMGEWEGQHYYSWDSDVGRLGDRFEKITKESFPCLQAVILYGNWAPVLAAHYWLRIAEGLNQRGFSLEYPDGRLVEDRSTPELSGLHSLSP